MRDVQTSRTDAERVAISAACEVANRGASDIGERSWTSNASLEEWEAAHNGVKL